MESTPIFLDPYFATLAKSTPPHRHQQLGDLYDTFGELVSNSLKDYILAQPRSAGRVKKVRNDLRWLIENVVPSTEAEAEAEAVPMDITNDIRQAPQLAPLDLIVSPSRTPKRKRDDDEEEEEEVPNKAMRFNPNRLLFVAARSGAGTAALASAMTAIAHGYSALHSYQTVNALTSNSRALVYNSEAQHRLADAIENQKCCGCTPENTKWNLPDIPYGDLTAGYIAYYLADRVWSLPAMVASDGQKVLELPRKLFSKLSSSSKLEDDLDDLDDLDEPAQEQVGGAAVSEELPFVLLQKHPLWHVQNRTDQQTDQLANDLLQSYVYRTLGLPDTEKFCAKICDP